MSTTFTKVEFARLVFSRRRPEDFESIVRFNVSPKSTLPLENHYFYAGLAVHALDMEQQCVSLICDDCAGLDIRMAIQHLAEIFELQTFEKNYVHDIMLVLTKPFTTAVANFFQQRYPVIASNIDAFLRTKHRLHMQQKRKKEISQQSPQRHR